MTDVVRRRLTVGSFLEWFYKDKYAEYWISIGGNDYQIVEEDRKVFENLVWFSLRGEDKRREIALVVDLSESFTFEQRP